MRLESPPVTCIDLSEECVVCPTVPIGEDRAWLAADLCQADWRVPLSERAVAEVGHLVEAMHANPLPMLLRDASAFEVPQLRAALARAKTVLDEGCGFAVVDALPMDGYAIDDMVSAFWILGQLIGTPVAQKWDGTMIYDVTDSGKPFGYGVRGSATNVELVFHTDNAFGARVPEYVGLMCRHRALEGGVSRFCSLYALHNRLLAQCPRLLARLYRPMLFDRQAEHAPGGPKTSWAPFFTVANGKLAARANVSLVRKGYEVAGEAMDAQLTEALAAAHEVSSSPDLWYEAPLSRGQVQYLNNRELGHYRSTFRDHRAPDKRRHLYRSWHREAGSRNYDG